jgi:hypothetical protein
MRGELERLAATRYEGGGGESESPSILTTPCDDWIIELLSLWIQRW